MNRKHYLLILLGLGLLTRFIFFGYPAETVFDEVHFGKFISGYYTGEYFFDIHPPLGKEIIAGFAKLFNFKPGFAFSEIGNKYPDKQYMILRFLPSLAGALLPSVIFILALEIGLAPLYAFAAGAMIVLDNALLTQSRFILMDSFLLLFGFLSLIFYFKYRSQALIRNTKYLILFSIFAGLAVSIKWTGIGFLALPLIFEFISLIKQKKYEYIIKLFYPVIIAFLVYFSLFAIHLKLLNKSGPGDAFMSAGFQKTLTGNINKGNDSIKSSNLFHKFTELNAEMYKANQRLDATHPYSSRWYSWPIMTRPIYYWVNNNPSTNSGQSARIYLIGNPFIWWLTTAGLIFVLLNFLMDTKEGIKDKILIFLLTGYFLNMLPFIGVKRVMFLYHYFTALIFSIIILAYLANKQKISWKITGIFLILTALLFIFFAPLNYGLELSPKTYEARVWFNSWK